MLLIFTCILAGVTAAPSIFYDQGQEGETNFQADISNIFILISYPKGAGAGVTSVLDALFSKRRSEGLPIAQDRSDVHSMEAFVEPNKPYQVVIGAEGEKPVETDGGDAIVIAARRRSDTEAGSDEEMKLLGATEQCGPGMKRDPVDLTCGLDTSDEAPEKTPEVIVVKT